MHVRLSAHNSLGYSDVTETFEATPMTSADPPIAPSLEALDGNDHTVQDVGSQLLVRWAPPRNDSVDLYGDGGDRVVEHVGRSTPLLGVGFSLGEHAVRACAAADGQYFQGRILHVMEATPLPEPKADPKKAAAGGTAFQRKRDAELKASAEKGHNWNALFMRADAVGDAVAREADALLVERRVDREGEQRAPQC